MYLHAHFRPLPLVHQPSHTRLPPYCPPLSIHPCRLLGQCSQPRPGVMERRERAEKIFQEQRSAAAAAAGATTHAEAEAVEAAAASAATAAVGWEGRLEATTAPSRAGAIVVPPAVVSAPCLHSTISTSKAQVVPPALFHLWSGHSAVDNEVAVSPDISSTCKQRAQSGAGEQCIQAPPEGSPMIRGPGGQWRAKPTVGGGTGRARGKVPQKSFIWWLYMVNVLGQ